MVEMALWGGCGVVVVVEVALWGGCEVVLGGDMGQLWGMWYRRAVFWTILSCFSNNYPKRGGESGKRGDFSLFWHAFGQFFAKQAVSCPKNRDFWTWIRV
ncbi:MAG: hypothetical protein Q4F28_07655 [Eubacteriales bacterium]|nr:hypothetical protein [Eubacteriales bacterium]